MERTNHQASNCSIARTLQVVGEKWTLLIIRESFYGATRFEQFHRVLQCARNLLSERLTVLVEEGILDRFEYGEPSCGSVPPAGHPRPAAGDPQRRRRPSAVPPARGDPPLDASASAASARRMHADFPDGPRGTADPDLAPGDRQARGGHELRRH